MPAASSYACAIVTAAMIVSANAAYAQETRLKVPKVIVVAEAAPGEPPYMRDPAKAYARNPYFGRYRVAGINSPRCRARQHALLLLRAADACKGNGSLSRKFPRRLVAIPATWRWTWSAPTPGNCISKRISWPLIRTKSRRTVRHRGGTMLTVIWAMTRKTYKT